MDVRNVFNSISRTTIFFRSCNLLLVFQIIFLHLSNDFMHAHPHDIFHMFFDMRIHNHFVQVWYMTRGVFWVEYYLFYHIFVFFALL